MTAQKKALTQAKATLEEQTAAIAQAEKSKKNAEQLTTELASSKEELAALQAQVKELKEEIARLKEQLSQQGAQQAVQQTVAAQVPAEQEAPAEATAAADTEQKQVAPVQQETLETANLDQDNDGTVDATIILSGVNFKVGTASLTDQAAASLLTTAKLLQEHAPDQHFEVAGYTDSMGSPKRNQQISEQRAEAVRNFLIEQGITADLLVSKGYGQDNPIADNNTPEGRAMNRRVELHQVTAE